jgi:hypothetical protein
VADTDNNSFWRGLISPPFRPWLALAGEVPASIGAHIVWSDQPMVAVGMTVAAGALTLATWWAGKDTTPQRRAHATFSTAAATAYLTVAAFTNPVGSTQLTFLTLGGGTLAASWNVRKALRINPDTSKDGAAVETGILTKSLGNAKVMLRGTPKVEPNKVTADYKIIDPGSLTNAEIGRRIDNIAAEVGTSPTAIRTVANPDNAAEGSFVFVPKDMLVEGAPYPGPSSPGGCMTEPIHLGIYEDGEPERFWYPADEKAGRNATHYGVFGMNGSAKSTGTVYSLIEVLTRYNGIVWAGDPSKGMQTFGPLLPYLDWVEITQAGCEAMVDALPQVITARADELGRHGFKNWTPEAFEKLGMPYMVVSLEETAKLFRDGVELEPLVEAARSAGISIEVSQQRPSSTSMPTDVREQLGGIRCYGVKESTTADMALPEDVREAGARPEAWENRKPGYHYLIAPGVPEDRYSMKLRHWDPIPDDAIRAVLEQFYVATPAGATTANSGGEAYANRTRYTPGQSLTSINTPEAAMSDTDKQIADEELMERQVNREVDARIGSDGEDTDVSHIDPDEEIPAITEGQVWTFAKAGDIQEDKTPEKAMAELLAMLEEYREEGLEEVGPRHFQPYGREGRIGRSRAWISQKLNELADEAEHLEDTDDAGVYRLLYPEMAAA